MEPIKEEIYKTPPDTGLSSEEARKRLKLFGPNRLKEKKKKGALLILIDQFKSLILLLLATAAFLSFIFKDWIEGMAILAVIVLNSGIGFFMEIKAIRSMEALHRLVRITTRVRREGKVQVLPAEELVPGDIVLLEGGDIVPADIRLINSSKLRVDESLLTGESAPVGKGVKPFKEGIPSTERPDMIFMGTAITQGSCDGVVVATGMNTELGRISSLVEEAREERTPLEKRLNQLGHKLIWATLGLTAAIAFLGTLRGKEPILMIETAIALAVAAIPEGLPIVATITLARGMLRMAQKNALINRLSAVETLGATNVICVDKTGTLTENRMTVTRLVIGTKSFEIKESRDGKNGFFCNGQAVDPLSNQLLRQALEIGVLCNNASIQETAEGMTRTSGDPLEVALLIAGARAGIYRQNLLKTLPEVREEAFDPAFNMMATFHKADGFYTVAVKGAPESVIEVCSHVLEPDERRELSPSLRNRWIEKTKELAEEGFRVIALAAKNEDSLDSNPYENLTLIGLVGLIDPPRLDVRESVLKCKEAGIRVVMVTGDHPSTALNIALAVGLVKDKNTEVIHGKDLKSISCLSEQERIRIIRASIFARVNPKQKLDIITLHQKNGSIVAMTGDGVNDAPALKKADIGIAMGMRGTQVACEAADMVLKDDSFSTIVIAIEQGRIIFNNIRSFVHYLISCNISEIMVVSLASIAAIPLPILPLQILFLNLVTDVFPALALGMGEGTSQVMKQPPRNPGEPIIKRKHWAEIFGYGVLITIAVIGALMISLNWLEIEEKRAVTVSFLTLSFAQLWHVFNMRESRAGFLYNEITLNPFIWYALGLCSVLILLVVYIPGLADILNLSQPTRKEWALVILMSMIPWVTGQAIKLLRRDLSSG